MVLHARDCSGVKSSPVYQVRLDWLSSPVYQVRLDLLSLPLYQVRLDWFCLSG